MVKGSIARKETPEDGRVSASQANAAARHYKKAIDFSVKPDAHFLDLSRELRQLYTTDRELFREYLKTSKTSLRKALYLIDIANVFVRKHKVAASRLREIGWTNLTVILKHVDAGNLAERLDQAQMHSTRDLKALMKGGTRRAHPHCVQLHFSKKDYAELKAALLWQGARPSTRGIKGKEAALMKIIRKLK